MSRAAGNLKRLYRSDLAKSSFVNLLGGCCEICGYDKCIGSLQFHHKDPTKKSFKLADIQRNISKYGMDVVTLEVQKCKLLCANCHGEYHYNQVREKWAKKLEEEK